MNGNRGMRDEQADEQEGEQEGEQATTPIDKLAVGELTARVVNIAASDGQVRLRLTATEDGDASVALFDLAGNFKGQMAIGRNGDPSLLLGDPDGSCLLASVAAGCPVVALFDAAAAPQLMAFLNAAGKPGGGACQTAEARGAEGQKSEAREPEGQR